jgi:hypothetical protein
VSEAIGGAMSTVVMHNVVSVDGYIADDEADIGPLFEWYFNGDAALTDRPHAANGCFDGSPRFRIAPPPWVIRATWLLTGKAPR